MLRIQTCKILLFLFIICGLVIFIFGLTQIPQEETKQILPPGQTTQDLTDKKNSIAIASLGFKLTMVGLGIIIIGIVMLWIIMQFYIANQVAPMTLIELQAQRQIVRRVPRVQKQSEQAEIDIVNETEIENVNTMQPPRLGPHIEYHII